MPDDDTNLRAMHLLQEIELGNWQIILDDVSTDLAEIFDDGMSTGLELTGVFAGADLVHTRAVSWAKERAASLVTMIEDNTRDMLRATVAQGIEEGWGAARLAEEIANSAGFSEERANLIARTEISAANNQGSLQGYREAATQGVRVLKEWVAGDYEDVCQDNEADGPIELDDVFSSGADAPPEHPRCECSLLPVLPEEEDETEEEG